MFIIIANRSGFWRSAAGINTRRVIGFVRAQDSFESKTSNATTEMGSTSYIIPLRSESDEDYGREPLPQLEPIIFKNKVAPTLPSETQTEPTRPRPNQSRSPLFRAKSREYDKSSPGTERVAAVRSTEELLIQNESGTAKIKRSIFRLKSNSAGGGTAGRQSKSSDRATSAKPSKKSKCYPGTSGISAKPTRKGCKGNQPISQRFVRRYIVLGFGGRGRRRSSATSQIKSVR